MSFLFKWITIAKKVIRSACRKMRQDKQHRLTNFCLIKTQPKIEQKTDKPTIKLPPTMKQPSITSFLYSKNKKT